MEEDDWAVGDEEEKGGVLAVRLEKAGRQFGELLFAVPQGWRAAEARVDGVKRYVRMVAPGVVALGLTLEGSAQVEVQFAKS